VFSPSSVTSGGSSTLSLTTSSSTPAGTYSVAVTGSGVTSHTATYTLTVTAPSGGCSGVAAWSATTAYAPGDVVSFNGHKWTSTWYSTGAEPGAPQSWAVWSDAGPC
jgi:chitodextrinase